MYWVLEILQVCMIAFACYSAFKAGGCRRAAQMYAALLDAHKRAERENWSNGQWTGILCYNDIVIRTLKERGL